MRRLFDLRAFSINLVLDIEIVVVGTEFTARRESREAVEKLLDADQWMIICNVATKTLHWDLVGCLYFIRNCSLISFSVGSRAFHLFPCH